MRRSGIAIATLLIAGAAAGCTGSDDKPDPSPSTTPTATTSADLAAEVPQSEGLPKIDIDGGNGSPIDWRLPADSTAGSPVEVTQRFLALYGQGGTPGTDTDIPLASSVATDGELAVARGRLLDGYVEGETRAGPLWIWLDSAVENGDHAVVRGCADVGYFQPEGATKPAKFRAEAWYTELKRLKDYDGKTVWKVSRHNAGPVRDSNPFEAKCPGWAKHRP